MKHRTLKRSVRDNLAGYTFIAPYLLGFLIFQFAPFLFAFVLGFTDLKYISLLSETSFVGFSNFIRFFKDPVAVNTLLRTLLFSAISVPLNLLVSFTFALMINQKIYARGPIRTMLFMPYVSNIMAISIVIKVLLGPNGPLLKMLLAAGVEATPPLYNIKYALVAVAAVGVWQGMGFAMVTYLAALQNVSSDQLEAAEIDGAGTFAKVRNIILPAVTPTTFFLTISGVIGSLQSYTLIKALTDGGPGQSTTLMSLQIMRTAFANYETSYATAQSIIMFVIIMSITIVQWVGQKKWVNY